jgi:hypothetical protein
VTNRLFMMTSILKADRCKRRASRFKLSAIRSSVFVDRLSASLSVTSLNFIRQFNRCVGQYLSNHTLSRLLLVHIVHRKPNDADSASLLRHHEAPCQEHTAAPQRLRTGISRLGCQFVVFSRPVKMSLTALQNLNESQNKPW